MNNRYDKKGISVHTVMKRIDIDDHMQGIYQQLYDVSHNDSSLAYTRGSVRSATLQLSQQLSFLSVVGHNTKIGTRRTRRGARLQPRRLVHQLFSIFTDVRRGLQSS